MHALALQGFIRYLRLLRLLRLLRISKVLKIFDVLHDLFRVPANVVRLCKLAFTVCMIAHMAECAWWYIKLQQSKEELLEFRIKNDMAGAVNV